MNISVSTHEKRPCAKGPVRKDHPSYLDRFHRTDSTESAWRSTPLPLRRRQPPVITAGRRGGTDDQAHALGEERDTWRAGDGARRPSTGLTPTEPLPFEPETTGGVGAGGRCHCCRPSGSRHRGPRYPRQGWTSMVRLVLGLGRPLAVVAANWVEGGYVMPLEKSGYQYLANVSVEDDSGVTVPRSVVIDSTISLLAFRTCPERSRRSDSMTNAASGAFAFGSSSNISAAESNGACFVVEEESDKLKWIDSTWSCVRREMDDGEVTLGRPEIGRPEIEGPNSSTREVTFPTARSEAGEVMDSVSSDVYAVADISGRSDSTLSAWNGAYGVLGLAQYSNSTCLGGAGQKQSEQHMSAFGKVLEQLADEMPQVFALDLGGDDYENTLEIGSYSGPPNGVAAGELIWGQSYPQERSSSWTFPAFDVRVCGTSLLGNVSSSWPARISTGSACLGLPEQLFDTLVAWAMKGGRCVMDRPKRVCYVPDTTSAAEDLPWLAFRLSEWGTPLYIPLSSLLIDVDPNDDDAEPGEKRLCVTSENSIYGQEDESVFNFDSFILLGSLVLESFYVVVDVDAPRVGLAQKGTAVDSTALRESGEEECEAAMVCNGSQAFQEESNTCELPACSRNFFYYLDEETMTCRTPKSIKILAWVVGIVFGVIEIVGHFLRVYYGGTGIALRGHGHYQGWEFHTGRLLEACISKVPWGGGAGVRGATGMHSRND